MTDREQLVKEARQALHCLYIAVDESIADSINRKVEAAFDCLLSLLPKEQEVVVPVEPTYEMCRAGNFSWENPPFPARYKAMIEARPK